MYSMVLLAALGSGPATPGADQPAPAVVAPPVVVMGGCTGCTGCYGCSGYMASCYGCGGGGLFHKHASCHGCCGGYASSSYGCCGGGGLFHKHRASYGCCGGGCYGSGCYGSGCYGSGYGNGAAPFYPAYPAYAVPVATGAAPFYYTAGAVRTIPAVVVPEATPDTKIDEKKKSANLRFELPANAVLFVDGVKTPGEGTTRSFYTPALDAGQKYFYDVRAEIAIDGKTIVEEKRVIVEAGAQLTESFPKVIAAAANATTVAGK